MKYIHIEWSQTTTHEADFEVPDHVFAEFQALVAAGKNRQEDTEEFLRHAHATSELSVTDYRVTSLAEVADED